MLKDELQRTLAEKEAAEHELEALKQAPAGSSRSGNIEQEHAEELQRKETLAKEVSRGHSRIKFADKKIQQLQEAADDIKQRVSLVLRAVPEAPEVPADLDGGAGLAHLREAVFQLEQDL